MSDHSTLVVRPNAQARSMGFATELQVGWKRGDDVWWWGSCKNEGALASLITDARSKHGEFDVERRDS